MPGDVGKNVREIVEGGVSGLLELSQRGRDWVSEIVQREVKRQLGSVGIATKDDIDSLRKRVRELERGSGGSSRKSASSSTRKIGARKSATKRSSPTRLAATSTPPTETEPPAGAGLGDPGSGTG